MAASGGFGPSTRSHIQASRLARALRQNSRYSAVMGWLRCRVSFSVRLVFDPSLRRDVPPRVAPTCPGRCRLPRPSHRGRTLLDITIPEKNTLNTSTANRLSSHFSSSHDRALIVCCVRSLCCLLACPVMLRCICIYQ